MSDNKLVTERTKRVVSDSIPLLARDGVDIVEKMYAHFFTNNPEFKKYFNRSHQAEGDNQQVEILAGYLLVYAENFINPEVLLPVLESAVKKHVSKGILPEHYPLVGKSLLFAIQAQYGLSDDDEILVEWAKAYEFLSRTMINLQAIEYKSQLSDENSCKNFRRLKVLEVIRETDEVVRLWIGTATQDSLPQGKPLQYITVYIPELDQTRDYSLTSSKRNYYEIAVKKDGIVSSHIHDTARPGTDIHIGMPFGGLTTELDELEKEVCIFSDGIGITAHLELLNDLSFRYTDKVVKHFYCVKNSAHHNFKTELEDLDTHINIHNIIVYSVPGANDIFGEDYQYEGRVEHKLISSVVGKPDSTSCFVCGSVQYMTDVRDALIKYGIPESQIHFEFIGPSNQSLIQ